MLASPEAREEEGISLSDGEIAKNPYLVYEPDAHLHARLQDRLIRILARLGREAQVQFLLATHSPQLLNAAPEGAVRVCMDGRVAPLLVQPDQLRLLEELGAMDRMEIVPLLTSRAVVFVENKRDRNLLQDFARKHWGEKKQQDVWRALTSLYTYQSPIDAGVLALGRQVRDLLNSPDIASGRPVRMVAIGDRDYRTDTSRRAMLRTHAGRAGTDAYRLDFKLLLWDANEIENYVLDRTAILSVLDRQAGKRGVGMEWQQQRSAFVAELDLLLEAQREHVRQSVATRIQQEDRRLALSTALDRADEFLAARWKQPERWCDAKAVLGGLRAWLQSRGLALRIAERADAERHRHHAEKRRRRGHQHWRQPRPPRPLHRLPQRNSVAAPQDVRVVDEQDGVVDDKPATHDDPHERLDAERGFRHEQRPDDADAGLRDRARPSHWRTVADDLKLLGGCRRATRLPATADPTGDRRWR